jgi:hypothetical protein
LFVVFAALRLRHRIAVPNEFVAGLRRAVVPSTPHCEANLATAAAFLGASRAPKCHDRDAGVWSDLQPGNSGNKYPA